MRNFEAGPQKTCILTHSYLLKLGEFPEELMNSGSEPFVFFPFGRGQAHEARRLQQPDVLFEQPVQFRGNALLFFRTRGNDALVSHPAAVLNPAYLCWKEECHVNVKSLYIFAPVLR